MWAFQEQFIDCTFDKSRPWCQVCESDCCHHGGVETGVGVGVGRWLTEPCECRRHSRGFDRDDTRCRSHTLLPVRLSVTPVTYVLCKSLFRDFSWLTDGESITSTVAPMHTHIHRSFFWLVHAYTHADTLSLKHTNSILTQSHWLALWKLFCIGLTHQLVVHTHTHARAHTQTNAHICISSCDCHWPSLQIDFAWLKIFCTVPLSKIYRPPGLAAPIHSG